MWPFILIGVLLLYLIAGWIVFRLLSPKPDPRLAEERRRRRYPTDKWY